MTSIVIDTNCIVSAHLIPNSIARKAFDKAFYTGVVLHSTETIAELAEVFSRRKFDKYISAEQRLSALSIFEKKSFFTEISIKISACRDARDNKFLELAVVGKASFIISGDKDLLVLDPFQNIAIISPAEFLNK
jgi:putative PIN family toxin of toxin-antitoxin system